MTAVPSAGSNWRDGPQAVIRSPSSACVAHLSEVARIHALLQRLCQIMQAVDEELANGTEGAAFEGHDTERHRPAGYLNRQNLDGRALRPIVQGRSRNQGDEPA